jgi:micrococcal nuclease
VTNKLFLKGRVVKVTDGDTIRIQHIPTLFGSFKPIEKGVKLSETTIVIRLAAVDCPETAKFGQSGQEGGKEATDFLTSFVEGKDVSVQVLGKDQYGALAMA